MTRIHLKSAVAAMVIVLGVGISHSNAVTIQGGTSAVVDGWQISPDAGVTIEADAEVGGLLIQKTVDFTSNNGLGILFQQVARAPKQVQFTIETITNSTGTDWTAFQFAFSGAATIDSASNVFVPPVGSGVDYNMVSLNAQGTAVTYTGSQLNGAVSNWGSLSGGNNLTIDAASTDAAPFASFGVKETPTGKSVTSPVPLPSSLYQSALGLLSFGLIAAVRKTIKSRA